MANFKTLIVSIFVLCLAADVLCKIVLPRKLRYLENMLNSEVVAKAAKIRQRIENSPNAMELGEKANWPMLLAKYDLDDKKLPAKPSTADNNFNNMYRRRLPF